MQQVHDCIGHGVIGAIIFQDSLCLLHGLWWSWGWALEVFITVHAEIIDYPQQ